jgi:hypothetical protein
MVEGDRVVDQRSLGLLLTVDRDSYLREKGFRLKSLFRHFAIMKSPITGALVTFAQWTMASGRRKEEFLRCPSSLPLY